MKLGRSALCRAWPDFCISTDKCLQDKEGKHKGAALGARNLQEAAFVTPVFSKVSGNRRTILWEVAQQWEQTKMQLDQHDSGKTVKQKPHCTAKCNHRYLGKLAKAGNAVSSI